MDLANAKFEFLLLYCFGTGFVASQPETLRPTCTYTFKMAAAHASETDKVLLSELATLNGELTVRLAQAQAENRAACAERDAVRRIRRRCEAPIH